MNFLPVFVFTVAVTLALPSHHTDSKWLQYKSTNKKSYKTPDEEQTRYEQFLRNLVEVQEHNAKYEQGLTTYKKGINRFSDWTSEEISVYLNRNRGKDLLLANNRTVSNWKKRGKLPDSVDWRHEGAVSDVKDEGKCAASWSFSTTGALEGLLKIKKDYMVALSEQNLIDCTRTDAKRCSSNIEVREALSYVIDNGIEAEDDYHYNDKVGECSFDSNKAILKIEDFDIVPDDDEQALQEAVAEQPISVKIDASCDFLFYKSGVFDGQFCDSTPNSLNHWSLVVGYGREKETDYWIVKNSWGLSWGEHGYVRMIRNNNNHCGIAASGVYPTTVIPVLV